MGKKVFVDLTHPFSAEIPRWPYFAKPVIDSMHTMAKGGVLTQRIDCVQHTGTHADAPRHVMEREFDGRRARYTHEMPVDAYTGDAVCLEIKIEPWGLILPEHLEDACKRADIQAGGARRHGRVPQHRHAPPVRRLERVTTTTHAAPYRGRQVVREAQGQVRGHGLQALDHPLHTAMGKNGRR
jgi:kynurenine formamidase